VLAEAAEQIRHDFRSVAGLACEIGKCSLDATRKVLLAYTERNCLLFSCLGEVGFESGPQKVRHDAFRDVVDLGESILGALERRKADELNRLSELVKVLRGFLHFLQAIANSVGLDRDLEDGIADGALMEEVIYAHRGVSLGARKTCEERARRAES
jgi:hypothetical protein